MTVPAPRALRRAAASIVPSPAPMRRGPAFAFSIQALERRIFLDHEATYDPSDMIDRDGPDDRFHLDPGTDTTPDGGSPDSGGFTDGAVLDTRTLARTFHDGTYLVWNVKGHVRFKVTRTAGVNAVIGGVFFDPPDVPAAPTEFTATSTSPYDLQLNWTDNATNETSYALEGSLDGVTWEPFDALPANAVSFFGDDAIPNVSYRFRVRAEHEFGASPWATAPIVRTRSALPDDLVKTPTRKSRSNGRPSPTSSVTASNAAKTAARGAKSPSRAAPTRISA